MSVEPKRSDAQRSSSTQFRRHIDTFLSLFANKETQGTYERCLREFVKWYEGSRQFNFLVQDVERYKSYLTHRKKLSEVSVSTYLTALRRFFDFLVTQQILSENPAKQVEGYKRPTSHVRSELSAGEVARLLRTLDRSDEIGLRDASIITLMIEAGLTGSEVVKLDVGDYRSGRHEAVLAVQRKGATTKDDTVVLSERVFGSISAYLSRRMQLFAKALEKSDPLFLSAGNRTRGQRMSTRGIRRIVNEHMMLAGIRRAGTKRITPQSLRYTAARRMARAGATTDEIRQKLRLGTAATAELYLKRSKSES